MRYEDASPLARADHRFHLAEAVGCMKAAKRSLKAAHRARQLDRVAYWAASAGWWARAAFDEYDRAQRCLRRRAL